MSPAAVEQVLEYANNSLPSTRLPRHTTFVSNIDLETCHRNVESADLGIDACNFVNTTESCHEHVNLFNYLMFMICDMNIEPNIEGRVLITIIMLLVILFYAVFLYLISAHFIVPNVLHVAEYVHVTMYDYGLTTIAVILSAPDVMWVLQECHKYSQNGTLILAHMLGKSFTTYAVGLAVICLRGQTKLPGFEFVLHTFIALVAFLITCLVLHLKLVDERAKLSEQMNVNMRAVAFCFTVVYVANIVYQILSKRRFGRGKSENARSLSHMRMNLEATERSGWSQFWHALNAFEHIKLNKLAVALLWPFWVVAALQIPVIDRERPIFGWCKYLTCINFMIFPWQTYYLKNARSTLFTVLCAVMAISATIVTMIYTSWQKPPKYQGFYAIAGIIFGMSTYHIVGSELESIIWQVSNFVYNLPDDIIMLTGFVLNNLLNIAIFGYQLVSRGYGNLACGVVVGIVLNQAFMVLPIIVHQYCANIKNFVVLSANSCTCMIFILVCFLTMIFALSATNFKLRLSHGIYLFIVYITYQIYLLLSYLEIIHPYGAYHTISVDLQRGLSEWA